LKSRLDLCFEELLPHIRKLLFPKKKEGTRWLTIIKLQQSYHLFPNDLSYLSKCFICQSFLSIPIFKALIYLHILINLNTL
jgi:hypothetical protein